MKYYRCTSVSIMDCVNGPSVEHIPNFEIFSCSSDKIFIIVSQDHRCD